MKTISTAVVLLLVLTCSSLRADDESFGWSTFFDRDTVLIESDANVPAIHIQTLIASLQKSGHDQIAFQAADDRLKKLPRIRVYIEKRTAIVTTSSDVAVKDVQSAVNMLTEFGVAEVTLTDESCD